MSYTPTNWANGKAPAINADNLNKIENELVKLDNLASVLDITETTETTMQNSYSGRLLVEEIGGESEQFTTTGKNLLKNTAKSQTINGITFTVNSDGSVTANGTTSSSTNADLAWAGTYGSTDAIIEKGKYVVSATGTSNIQLIFGYGNRQLGYVVNNDIEFNLDSDIAWVIVRVVAGVTLSNYTTYPMVRLASVTDAIYEPYTGGIPSPNPSYPQEIKKTVVSEIRTHGKNFLDARLNVEIANNDIYTINDIKEGDSLTIYIKQQVTNLDENYPNAQHYYWFYDKDGNDLKHGTLCTLVFETINQIKEKTQTLTAPKNTERFSLTLGTYFGSSKAKLKTIEAQVEKSNVFTGYEPYTESAITLSQPIDLYGKDGVQDVLTKQISRKFGVKVFNGSENWKASGTLTGRYYVDSMGCINFGSVLCTHAKGTMGSTVLPNECYLSTANQPNGRFLINTEFATVAEWKAHLAEHPLTVVYEMAEEVIEELPIADQIALNSLATYDGITYLEFDSEIEPIFKGEYGTSKVGGYTLEGMLAGRNGELYGKTFADRITALETTVVNNI